MNYKTLITCTALCSPIIALAGGPDHQVPQQKPFTFYVGANTGIDITQRHNQEFNNTPETTYEGYNEPAYAWTGGPNLGINFKINERFFMETELFYHWNQGKRYTSRSNSSFNKFSKLREFGASIMPGVRVNQGRLFLRAGLSKALFKRAVDTNTAINSGDNYKRYASGFHVGLGYRTRLLNQIYLQTDYIYSQFNRFGYLSSSGNQSKNIHINSNEFLIGMLYQFGHHTKQATTQTMLKLKGSYAGLQGIMNITSDNMTYGVPGTSKFIVPRSIHGGKVGVSYGYSQLFAQRFYLAEELSMQGIINDRLYSTGTVRSKMFDGLRYGLSMLPGYAINHNNLIYTRVGWQRAWFKKSGYLDINRGMGPNFNTYRNGLRLGLGYEAGLTSRLGLNCEYDYTTFKSIRTTSGTSEFTYKPRSHQIMLGLNYRFNIYIK